MILNCSREKNRKKMKKNRCPLLTLTLTSLIFLLSTERKETKHEQPTQRNDPRKPVRPVP